MRQIWLIMVCALALIGCKEEKAAPPVVQQEPAPAPSASSQPAFITAAATTTPDEASLPPAPTKAQPKLQTIKLYIGTNVVNAELAVTPLQVQTGMMWRTNMAEMDGMLFIFGIPHKASFWMRNTLLPLTCAYIDPSGTILETHDMKPRDLSSIPADSDQIQYVLEMNQGWFSRHGVSTGTVIRTDFGTLQETFFQKRR